MTPSLYRSFTFWSGLLLFGFIGWAWQDSTRKSSGVLLLEEWTALNVASGISFQGGLELPGADFDLSRRDIEPPLDTLRFPRAQILISRAGQEPFTWPKKELIPPQDDPFGMTELEGDPLWTLFHGGERDGWQVFIPHWLVLLISVALWSALLFWRKRRIMRSLRKHDGITGHQSPS